MQTESTLKEKKKDLIKWLKEKADQGDWEGIAKVILIAYSDDPGGELPLISAFPGDLAGEITKKDLLLTGALIKWKVDEYPKGMILHVFARMPVIPAIILWERIFCYKSQQQVAEILGCTRQYVQQQEKIGRRMFEEDKKLEELARERRKSKKEGNSIDQVY